MLEILFGSANRGTRCDESGGSKRSRLTIIPFVVVRGHPSVIGGGALRSLRNETTWLSI